MPARVDLRRSTGFGRVLRGDGQVVGEQRLAERELPVERLAIRVEQQLAGVTSVAGRRVERPVHPKAVALSRADVRQVGVPHVSVDLVEADSSFLTVVADQAQLDFFGDLGEQREVGTATVESSAQWIAASGPYGGQRGWSRRGATGRT